MKTCSGCGKEHSAQSQSHCSACRKAKLPSIKSVNGREPRVVTLDIETAPLRVYCWGLWEQNIGLDMVEDEWTILSFSAKWLDRKEVIFKHAGGRGAAKVRDDRAVCQELWNILNNADIVITQNGKSFDIKKINARLIMHGLKPYSPIRVIDTRTVAKRHFGFTSNKLEWMSQKVNKVTKKDKHKLFPGFELWAECMKDNPKAWAEMEKYNSLDVVSTEELYLHMRPWMEGHPNLANYTQAETTQCPRCSSTKLQKRGYARTQTGEYLRLQCKECGGWARSRYTLNSREKRESLLSC